MSQSDRVRKNTLPQVPDDLRAFSPADIRRAFDYLEKEFHLHKEWYKQYMRELSRVPRGMTELEFFFHYTRQHLEPSLQILLRRKDPVIISLARYLLRSRDAEVPEGYKAPNNFRNGRAK